MRNVHQISKVGMGVWPQQVVVVQCTMGQAFASDADATGTLAFRGWAAKICYCRKEVATWTARSEGVDAEGFWNWINFTARSSMPLWIISADARDHIAALELWDLLAKGQCELNGWNSYDSANEYGGSVASRPGLCILESPPTIVSFMICDTRQQCLWVDPANYGAGRWTELHATDDSVVLSADDANDGPAVLNGHAWGRVNAVGEWWETYLRICYGCHLGAPAHTAATQAMLGFRRSYMTNAITIHDSDIALKIEREALYGGRCECRYIGSLQADGEAGPVENLYDQPAEIRRGVGPIYHLDINALYPSVAAEILLPTQLMGLARWPSVDTVIACAEVGCTIAAVEIQTDDPIVPCRWEGRIIYPIGRFETTLCESEILLAAEADCIKKCSIMATYRSRPIYGEWVKLLWSRRKQYQEAGDRMGERTVKAILNASFGKWAQRSRRWNHAEDQLPPAPYCQWWETAEGDDEPTQHRSIAWQVERLIDAGEPPDSFPAITACINSQARVRLWGLLETVGFANVYYYDTDSIFCNQAAYDTLCAGAFIQPGVLGKLKLAGQHQSVRFMGRQSYVADGRLTLSGVREPHVKDGDSFARVLKIPPIQHHLLKGEPPSIERIVARVKVTRPYMHGHVQPDGSVTPIQFHRLAK